MAINRTNLLWRIILHWCFFSIAAAFVTSLFSTFYPIGRLWSYFKYGFEWESLEYFRYTLYFFIVMSAFVAVPGCLTDLYLFYRNQKITSFNTRKYAIIANTTITAAMLIIYSYQGITKLNDIIFVITPIYLFFAVISGKLLLPKKIN